MKDNAQKIIMKVEYTNYTSLGSGYLMQSTGLNEMAHANFHYVTVTKLS